LSEEQEKFKRNRDYTHTARHHTNQSPRGTSFISNPFFTKSGPPMKKSKSIPKQQILRGDLCSNQCRDRPLIMCEGDSWKGFENVNLNASCAIAYRTASSLSVKNVLLLQTVRKSDHAISGESQ